MPLTHQTPAADLPAPPPEPPPSGPDHLRAAAAEQREHCDRRRADLERARRDLAAATQHSTRLHRLRDEAALPAHDGDDAAQQQLAQSTAEIPLAQTRQAELQALIRALEREIQLHDQRHRELLYRAACHDACSLVADSVDAARALAAAQQSYSGIADRYRSACAAVARALQSLEIPPGVFSFDIVARRVAGTEARQLGQGDQGLWPHDQWLVPLDEIQTSGSPTPDTILDHPMPQDWHPQEESS